jgi:hypothetical protein
MSACLQRSKRRSQRAIYQVRMSMAVGGRKGMGAALDGTVGRRSAPVGSACNPGKTARCRGSSCPPLTRLPSTHVKVTDAWPHVCAGIRPAMPPTSAAVWNTDQMPGLARPSPGFPLL